jgi:pre-mRNA cleavage complex 2 protein Pcf11
MFFGRKCPNIAEFLYGQSTTRCKQCGVQFADTAAGNRNDHLDMHFRRNPKATQNVGRGHSRSWFISIEVSHYSYGFGPALIYH